MQKIYIDKNELIRLYNKEKRTIYQIAELFHCSPALISKNLKNNKISTWWKPVKIEKEKLENLYCGKKLTVAKIANYYNCGQTTVVNKMQGYGIISRKKIILFSKDALEELYQKRKFKQKEIANLLGCNQATISNKMKEARVKAREKSEINTKYPKYDFSNNLTEKSYLIGFRIGDLHVRKHRNLISVECTTTRLEQTELIKGLFAKYTHVHIGPRKDGRLKIACLLNQSFCFLLEKKDTIPEWILDDNNLFLAFLAGYADAEGCIGIYSNKKNGVSIVFILRTYDKNILIQTWNKLIKLDIICPRPYICTLKGKQNNRKDFWKLGIYKRKSLKPFLDLIRPHAKHPRIIFGINKALSIIK